MRNPFNHKIAISDIVQRVRSHAEVVVVLTTVSVSMIIVLLNVPNQWFTESLRVVTGLIDTCLAPGVVIVKLLYRHDDETSLLLKWVLVLLLSAAFEVVLATIMSVSGLVLNYPDITLIQGVMLFIGGVIVILTGAVTPSKSSPSLGHKRWTNPSLIMGIAIAAVVISAFLPKLTDSSPAIYITDSAGSLSLLQSPTTKVYHVYVHVVNPTSHAINVELQETTTGSKEVLTLIHTLLSKQSWTVPVSVQRGGVVDSLKKVTFTLTESHDPSFRRTVWFYHH